MALYDVACVVGVCLGAQGIVEHFGGALGKLGYPMHGKPG
jgi:anthranilate synthase